MSTLALPHAGWRHGPQRARHLRRAQSWEKNATRVATIASLGHLDPAGCGYSHTACGYYRLGSSPAGERLRLDGINSSRPPQRNELEAGHGELTEPRQRVIAVAHIDVRYLVGLADAEYVVSQGVVDAAHKDRHSSPRVVGGNDPHRSIDESQCAYECGLAEKKASLPRGEWLPWLEWMNYLFTMKDAKSDLGVPPEPEDARP
jgi:hypothetical protein